MVGHLAKTTNQSLVQYTEEYKNTCVKECVKEYKYPSVCGTFVVRGTWYMVRGTCVCVWYVVRGTVTVTVTVSFCRFDVKVSKYNNMSHLHVAAGTPSVVRVPRCTISSTNSSNDQFPFPF